MASRKMAPMVAASVAAAASVGQPASTVLALTLIPSLLTLCVEGWGEYKRKAVGRFFERMYSDPNRTAEEMKADLETKAMRSQDVRGVVLRAVQRLLEADESVVGALAALAQEYAADERGPDAFFRGFSGLLAEVSREEFEAFRTMMRGLTAGLDPSMVQVQLMWSPDQSDGPPFVLARLYAEGAVEVRKSATLDLGRIAHPDRTVYLLRKHGLGEGTEDTGRWSSSEHRWVQHTNVPVSTVVRMGRLVEP